MAETPTGISRLPLAVPLAVGSLAALAELGAEPLRLAWRYDRVAIASGEVWRLITGHIVHLGPGHAAMNVLALLVLMIVLGRYLTTAGWWLTSIVAALAIDAGLYWLSPEVVWYVGLSGVLHGYWAAACVAAFRQRRNEAWGLSALLLLKLAYEAFAGPVPLTGEIAAGPVVAVAHLYGAAGGIVASALGAVTRRRGRSL